MLYVRCRSKTDHESYSHFYLPNFKMIFSQADGQKPTNTSKSLLHQSCVKASAICMTMTTILNIFELTGSPVDPFVH